jgi:hypothetical protein
MRVFLRSAKRRLPETGIKSQGVGPSLPIDVAVELANSIWRMPKYTHPTGMENENLARDLFDKRKETKCELGF